MNKNPDNIIQKSLKQKIILCMTKISLALRNSSWKSAGLQGLTPTQGHILTLFCFQSNPQMRLSEIAEAMAIAPATASAAIAILVEKNLVEKHKSKDDGRVIDIALTSKGLQQAKQFSYWTEFLVDAIDQLSSEEKKALFSILLKVIYKLQKKKQIPISKMCVTCRFFQPNIHANSLYPHYCGFVKSYFGNEEFQIECQDHALANEDTVKRNSTQTMEKKQ